MSVATPQPVLARLESDLKAQLRSLPKDKRGHLALRLYRTSGDDRYLADLRSYAGFLLKYLRAHAESLERPGYIAGKSRELVSNAKNSQKRAARAVLLQKDPDFTFRKRVLFLMYQIKSFGLAEASPADFSKLIAWLGKADYVAILTDPEVLRFHTTAAVNMVYYLKDLGIVDVEQPFAKAFREHFTEAADKNLSAREYQNKIYGLTHFIIDGSRYYQELVSPRKYAWILDYFSRHRERVLSRAKPDSLAEIGLCFKLAGRKKDPLVGKIQEVLVGLYDAKKRVITSSWSKNDRKGAEHRGIVAYMLLKDWDRLYSGPDLGIGWRKGG